MLLEIPPSPLHRVLHGPQRLENATRTGELLVGEERNSPIGLL